MRGGRVSGIAGQASQPDTFYFGSVGGGVWKTENAKRTWFPISDNGISIGSIGAIAVAPSDPNILYVGTGEVKFGVRIPTV
ncbi:MAG: WD40/YVTN/BNR-like repeat-containing protein [Bryobacteraceae bacterium]